MGKTRTLKWIPNDLLERVRVLAQERGFSENEMLRRALFLGIELLEREKDLLKEIEEIKERLRKLEEGAGKVGEVKRLDPFIENLVEGV